MSTTFAIIKENEEGEKNIRIDVAHRRSIGGGKCGIKWFNISLYELFNITKYFKHYKIDEIPVHAMDNTAQGVENIGDLITLDECGRLDNVNK
tara:strand:+ start:380 stop:658 length:279 start_codon:yes stop_codon:yes gene_type:complete